MFFFTEAGGSNYVLFNPQAKAKIIGKFLKMKIKDKFSKMKIFLKSLKI